MFFWFGQMPNRMLMFTAFSVTCDFGPLPPTLPHPPNFPSKSVKPAVLYLLRSWFLSCDTRCNKVRGMVFHTLHTSSFSFKGFTIKLVCAIRYFTSCCSTVSSFPSKLTKIYIYIYCQIVSACSLLFSKNNFLFWKFLFLLNRIKKKLLYLSMNTLSPCIWMYQEIRTRLKDAKN